MNEQLRYIYPLDIYSVVIDLGGYEGKWSKTVHDIYGCNVDCYEPIPQFFNNVVDNCRIYPAIRTFNCGVGGSERDEVFHLDTDRTGVMAEGQGVDVKIKDIKDIVGNRTIDLIKLNIEGMEYEVLERAIECDIIKQLKNIQVQFHRIGENYEQRYEQILNTLLKTHELEYNFPFVWQSFKIK